MSRKMFTGSRKNFFSYTTCLAGAAAAAMALAPVSASAQDAAEEDEEIIVTGTRIRQNDFVLSNPVASADAATIQQSGATNLTSFIQDMPALLNSFDSEDSADTENGGTQGLNLLDLRALGTQRTLVLVDGRRHVAGNEGSAAVDVNTIPVDLVERIEVLTGGASAIYGADAVTGVVNFIMRDDFDGLQGRVQYGEPEAGGASDLFASVIAGRNFAGGRGNFTLAFEMSQAEELNSRDRDFSTPGLRETLVENPADTDVNPGDNDGIPDFDFFRNVRYVDTSPQGTVFSDFTTGTGFFGQSFLGDGSPWVNGTPAGDFTMIGGSGSLLDSFIDQLLPGLDRYTLSSRFHYDLNNNHRVFGEAKWARTETLFEGQVTYDFFMFLPIDNPFIPANILADANGPTGNGTYYGGVFMARDNFDLGSTYQDIERNTYRTVLGLEGDLSDRIRYEASMVWGRTETTQRYRTRNNERWFAAIDAIDPDGAGPLGPTCRSNDGVSVPADWGLPSFFLTFNAGECIAANIFGDNVMSDAARNWIMTELEHEIAISQFVLGGFISGDTEDYFSLPAGPVSFSVGLEYREEESEYDHAALGEIAENAEAVVNWEAYDVIWGGRGKDSFGRFDVAEVYGELTIPLLADLPFAHSLTADAAYRLSEYSTVGQTDTWKYGLRWRPVEWLMLRGTEAEAVRAPNISELFLPTTQTFGVIADPCDDNDVNDNPGSSRLANCTAEFVALNALNPAIPADPNLFNNTTSTSIPGFASGNRDLEAETGSTITYGIVMEPPVLPGLSISVDYWSIELEQAIELLSGQQIVDFCYDLPQPNQYCGLVDRTVTGIPALSVPAGGVSSFTTTFINISSYEASGYDIGVRYLLDPADIGINHNIGEFLFGLNATRLDSFQFLDSAGGEPAESVGDPGFPDWQVVFDATWTFGDFRLNYGYSWFSETARFSSDEISVEPDIVSSQYFNFSERSVHDLYAQYDFSDRFSLYGGVNNFTDQLPDRGAFATPVSPLGRFFYIGARANF